ncbi:MAG: pyruvate synthase subunit beta, partial [Candidatus Saccharicenans sp.]
PIDLVNKLRKAKEIKGTRFIHVYAPCPTGWKSRPDDTVKLARLAVQTGYFPLYEVENGEMWTLNLKLKERKPIIEYLKLQGRFRHLKDEEIAMIQKEVDRNWDRILKKCDQAAS